ncbi:hypothetical protein [Streptomyces decoyicus]|uniref:hypothetical protein n=1 Tax=Streptomyces decoyicus TaxID=249567 RepID=UPI003870CFD6
MRPALSLSQTRPHPPSGEPIPPTKPSELDFLIGNLHTYRVRFASVHRWYEETLDELSNAHGVIGTVEGIAAADKARAERNETAFGEFGYYVLSHTDTLLAAARSALDTTPYASQHDVWRRLLDDLAHAASEMHLFAAQARSSSDQHGAHYHDVKLWLHLVKWATRSQIVSDLAEAHNSHRSPADSGAPLPRPPRPIDIAETAVTLDAVAARLDDHISPHEAAKLLRPVFSSHQGLLLTLSNLAASAARYTDHRTDHIPQDRSLARDLGILAHELRDWSQVLHTTAEDVAKLASPAPGRPAATERPAVSATAKPRGRHR